MKNWFALLCALPLVAVAAPERIVALGGDVTEIVYALGAESSLVARDSTSQWPQATKALPDVGYLRQLNAEGILSVRPTLVLASDQAQPSLALKQVEQSHVRVVTVPAMAAGQQTGADAAIRAAGLQNAMQGFTRYQPLSQEGVMASQPDLVVISQDGLNALGGEQNLWKLPGLAQTPAGRSKQVLAIDDMALLGFSVRTPKAIQQLRARAEQLP